MSKRIKLDDMREILGIIATRGEQYAIDTKGEINPQIVELRTALAAESRLAKAILDALNGDTCDFRGYKWTH